MMNNMRTACTHMHAPSIHHCRQWPRRTFITSCWTKNPRQTGQLRLHQTKSTLLKSTQMSRLSNGTRIINFTFNKKWEHVRVCTWNVLTCCMYIWRVNRGRDLEKKKGEDWVKIGWRREKEKKGKQICKGIIDKGMQSLQCCHACDTLHGFSLMFIQKVALVVFPYEATSTVSFIYDLS